MIKKRRILLAGVVCTLLLCGSVTMATETAVQAEHPPSASVPDKNIIHLSLEQAIGRALKFNRSLKDGLLYKEGQQLALDSSKTDFDYKVYPVADTGVNQSGEFFGLGLKITKKLTSGVEASLTPRYGSLDNDYTGMISGAVSIPLLKGRGEEVTLDRVKSSEFNLKNALYQQRQLNENVVLDVILTVYQIINRQKQLDIYQASIGNLQEEVVVARAKEKVGLAGPIDVYRAEIGVKEVEDSLISTAESLKQAQDRLKILLVLPHTTSIAVSAPLVQDASPYKTDAAVDIALKRRVDIIQLRLQAEEIERKVKLARHNLLPQADIRLSYENTSVDFIDDRLDEGTENWAVNLISTTELRRNEEKTALSLALLDLRRKKIALLDKIDAIREDISNQMRELEKSRQRLEIRRKQASQAASKLAVAKVKFIHGMSDNFDVIQSEKELQNAKINMLNIRTEYMVGTYRLRKQIGTLLD